MGNVDSLVLSDIASGVGAVVGDTGVLSRAWVEDASDGVAVGIAVAPVEGSFTTAAGSELPASEPDD